MVHDFEGQRAAILSKQAWSLMVYHKECHSLRAVVSRLSRAENNRPILPVRDYMRSAVSSFYSVGFQYF